MPFLERVQHLYALQQLWIFLQHLLESLKGGEQLPLASVPPSPGTPLPRKQSGCGLDHLGRW